MILDKGNGVFKEGVVPEDKLARIEELDSLDINDISWLFDELDREFSLHQDNLNELNLRYVLANKEAFM